MSLEKNVNGMKFPEQMRNANDREEKRECQGKPFQTCESRSFYVSQNTSDSKENLV